MSGLQLGISMSRIFFFALILKPNLSRIFWQSLAVTEKPINFSKLFISKLIFLFLVFISPEILIFEILPPQIS